MKEKTGEKCTQKKKKIRNEKNRTSEKKESGRKLFFGQSESELLLHRAMWYLQVGSLFFFSLYLLFKLERLQFYESGEKTLGPQFSFSFFFSYQIHQNIIFSFILFFSIILKIHPTKQISLEKSSISLY